MAQEGFGIRLIAILGALSVAMLAIAATPAHAAFPGFNGRIAYSGITAVYPNGRDLIGLNATRADTQPSWSPDGSEVVVERFIDGEEPPAGYIVHIEGGQIPLGDDIADPAWSPDGTKVVFRAVGSGIGVINADATGRTVVLADDVANINTAPVWSPDGQKIAFVRCPPSFTSCNIYTMNPDGTALTALTSDAQGNTNPSWSPDASKIVFARGPSGSSGIWVMNANGSNPVQIGVGSFPSWSPDGQQIAFMSSCANFSCELRRMNVDGSGSRLVRPDAGGATDWQPCATPCPPPPPPPYDTPLVARHLRVSIVPNFRQTISNTQCAARGGAASSHSPPLALQSCNPPGYVPGTTAHLGNDRFFGTSYVDAVSRFGDVRADDTADVMLNGDVSDVRTIFEREYAGSITVITKIRITDTNNGAASIDPATVVDFDLSVPVECFGTPDYPGGARCVYGTSADALVPGIVTERKDTVLQVFRVRVNDSGADGIRGNADDRTFASQGVFIP